MFDPTSAPQPLVHAEPIRSALSDRFLGGLLHFPGQSWQCVFLRSGAVNRIGPQTDETIAAPAVLWCPSDPAIRLRAKAGSSGSILTQGETTLANAIGHKPEAAALRMMFSRRLTLGLQGQPDTIARLQSLFDAILTELDADVAGMETVIEAQIRIILVTLWRITAARNDQPYTTASAAQTLETFRQLLETHMRERWTVRRYAQELGITPDRLHDICTRLLGKSPQVLIHERLTQEAQAVLEGSAQTLDQIADYLGFPSTPQFSAFFRTRTGLPPGAFRKAIRTHDGAYAQPRTHADWP